MSDDQQDERDGISRALEVLEKEGKALVDTIDDLNSSFPATREFLRSRGKTHVQELMPDEMRQLQAHLQAELDALNRAKDPDVNCRGVFFDSV